MQRDVAARIVVDVGGSATIALQIAPTANPAVATLLARRGVCRDYAHLVVALLRSLDVRPRRPWHRHPDTHPVSNPL